VNRKTVWIPIAFLLTGVALLNCHSGMYNHPVGIVAQPRPQPSPDMASPGDGAAVIPDEVGPTVGTVSAPEPPVGTRSAQQPPVGTRSAQQPPVGTRSAPQPKVGIMMRPSTDDSDKPTKPTYGGPPSPERKP
jgi:hypothetical protein